MRAYLKIWLHNGLGVTLDVTSSMSRMNQCIGGSRALRNLDRTTFCYQPTRRQCVPFISRLCEDPYINDKFDELQRSLEVIDSTVDVRNKFQATGPVKLIVYTDNKELETCVPFLTKQIS